MEPIEIIVIILIAAFFAGIIGRYIYKRVHHMPTVECSCCASRMKKNLKHVSKEISKEHKCCCSNK